jgi:hypothetical protein
VQKTNINSYNNLNVSRSPEHSRERGKEGGASQTPTIDYRCKDRKKLAN